VALREDLARGGYGVPLCELERWSPEQRDEARRHALLVEAAARRFGCDPSRVDTSRAEVASGGTRRPYVEPAHLAKFRNWRGTWPSYQEWKRQEGSGERTQVGAPKPLDEPADNPADFAEEAAAERAAAVEQDRQRSTIYPTPWTYKQTHAFAWKVEASNGAHVATLHEEMAARAVAAAGELLVICEAVARGKMMVGALAPACEVAR
jgi:hypothetical protein